MLEYAIKVGKNKTPFSNEPCPKLKSIIRLMEYKVAIDDSRVADLIQVFGLLDASHYLQAKFFNLFLQYVKENKIDDNPHVS